MPAIAALPATAQGAWASDGAFNLVTSKPLRLKGGVALPHSPSQQLQLQVVGVPVPGKARTADWLVSAACTAPRPSEPPR